MRSLASVALAVVLLANPAWSTGPFAAGQGRPPQDPYARPHDNRGYDRNPPADRRMDRREQRRGDGALTDEERRGLHRDLDKANRELYRRR